MICEFTVDKKPVYINSSSIIGIMHGKASTSKRAYIYCEEPVGCLMVDETVEEAYAEWLLCMEMDGVMDDEPDMTWTEAALGIDEDIYDPEGNMYEKIMGKKND